MDRGEHGARGAALAHIKKQLGHSMRQRVKAKAAVKPALDESQSEHAADTRPDEDAMIDETFRDAGAAEGEAIEHDAMNGTHSREEFPHEEPREPVRGADQDLPSDSPHHGGQHPSMEHARTILEVLTGRAAPQAARVSGHELERHDTDVMHGPSAVPSAPMPHVPNQGKKRRL